MASKPADPARRIQGTPRVIVTRALVPSVQERMAQLFDCRFNESDTPLSREELIEAMRDCDVLVPTVTDRIESAVGRDLQFIRINGTLVGGLVGVTLHAITQLF